MACIQHTGTVVIGAGQAGLAAGRELQSKGEDYVILEARSQLGEPWRERWDSLRLFTPAQYDGLPGLAFPAVRGNMPGKDDVAAYLEAYADSFRLAVRFNRTAVAVRRAGRDWVVATAEEETYAAAHVIVATGAHPLARIPAFSTMLAPHIAQFHSGDYRNPDMLPDGDVLIVGAGTSGAQIALELAATRPVTIAGRPTPHVPDLLRKHAGRAYWFFVNSVLTRATPLGRKAAEGFTDRGAPLIGISMRNLREAGVARAGRVTGVDDGWPVFDDGSTLHPSTVIWATGYRPDLTWIDGLTLTPDGWPVHRRGVIEQAAGLYVLGMPFQYALTSTLIGGVGRDARYIADRIASDEKATDG